VNVRPPDWESEPPDPEKIVNFTVPHPIAVQDARRIVRLTKELGFTVKGEGWVAAGETPFTKAWTRDVVHSAARTAWTGDVSPADVYNAVRRALRRVRRP
jgi:hypothetical protein